MDGVSAATMNAHTSKGVSINIAHKNPTMEALKDFRNNKVDNKLPISNVHTGANSAIAVQLSLDAMNNNEVKNWDKDLV